MRTAFAFIHRLLVALFSFGAQIEFSLWADNHRRKQMIRRIHLWLMRVEFGTHIYCGPNIMLRKPGNLKIGNRCSLGYNTKIWNYESITIGEDFVSAMGLVINTGGHDVQTMRGMAAPISIGHRVWCGVNVTILAGVTIGDDVVIAAGSIVNRSIPSNTIVAGVPARPLRRLERNIEQYDRTDWG